ncbi:MAG: aminotransferase class I/II-fold pyridoxal phosphate-dependent enzyme, partial [bacterium]|nr:aminotransferase class I/II-fold pyridoxal phosphate-dependent enzyme [bacterium]
ARVYLLCDVVYDNVHFAKDAVPLTKTLLAMPPPHPRIVVTNSFSKAYRLYTRRVGWCILPEELVRPMTVIQQHTRLTVDPAVQLGAVEALKHAEDVAILAATYARRWAYARECLSHLPGIRLLPTSGGFYFVLDCRPFIAEQGIPHCLRLATDILERVHVATVSGADFGIPGALRVSFTDARFNEGVDRMLQYFSQRPDLRTSASPRDGRSSGTWK